MLHASSLPTGDLSSARYFLDWLARAGQSWWQVLPIAPPDRYGSPYAGASAFAGNPGLLARPSARVRASEIEEFVQRHWYWIGGWAHLSGREAIADQVRFEREWAEVRAHARGLGISILGDVPFYVAHGSADQQDRPVLFEAESAAGVPPDAWSDTGQLRGNPTYDWAAMRKEGYRWWIERFRRIAQLFDAVRIDHFRGFVAYWSVPRGSKSALGGAWRKGPGRELFDAVVGELGDQALVAENLGTITPPVERLRTELDIPGTIVIEFEAHARLLEQMRSGRSVRNVVYTGTHDNYTAASWWKVATRAQREYIERATQRLGLEHPEPHWKLVRLALHHPAMLSIVPLQDFLGLGEQARMNFPGRTRGNWRWRITPEMLTASLAARLKDETQASGR